MLTNCLDKHIGSLNCDRCQAGMQCISSRCQRPLAGGTGPCKKDPSSCVVGTQCDSKSDTCRGKVDMCVIKYPLGTTHHYLQSNCRREANAYMIQ
jgi:hypothetical protein